MWLGQQNSTDLAVRSKKAEETRRDQWLPDRKCGVLSLRGPSSGHQLCVVSFVFVFILVTPSAPSWQHLFWSTRPVSPHAYAIHCLEYPLFFIWVTPDAHFKATRMP